MGKSKLNTIKFPLEKYVNLLVLQFNFFGSFIFSIFIIVFLYAINLKHIAIILLLSTLTATALVSIIRLIFRRERPKKQPYNNIFEKINSSSFPSMHALRTSIYTTTMFISSLYLLASIFLLITILVSIARYTLKKHYISDLIVGIIFGILIVIATDFSLQYLFSFFSF